MTVLTVVWGMGGFHGCCSAHGRLPTIWRDPLLASYDALGHAAHHHRPHPLGAVGAGDS